MNSAEERYVKLVDRLHHLTIEKKLSWKIDNMSDELTCQFSRNKLTLEEGRDADGQPNVKLCVMDFSDDVIDSFTDTMLMKIKPSNQKFENHWFLMKDLYVSANRQATGADKAIDDILNELEDDDDL